jgi:pyruvate/2-oxoglutarate dehydrogenase complex dihydrolipoamide dehydrogenase (E3) component
MDDIYDLVVIGAGPAGEVAADLAASFGRRVLIVERHKPGGVVTTTGGAPTKALREAALYLTGYRQEEVYGVQAAAPLDVVLPIIRARIEQVRDDLQDIVAHRLAARGIAYLQGIARLGADRTVHVTSPDGVERDLAARTVLVATGSRPTHAARIPFDDPDVYDSDEIYSVIYAAGDVVNPALASTAMQQGRAAAAHACGLVFGVAVDQTASSAVYGLPEVAGVGTTEEQVRAAGIPYAVGRCDLAATPRGAIAGRGGLLKLIFRADDRTLLGVYCFGDIASEVVGLGHVVLHAGGNVEVFLTRALNTPTYSYAYHDAAVDGLTRLAEVMGIELTAGAPAAKI